MAKQPVLAAGLGRDNKPTLGRVRHILGLRPTQRNCPFWLAGVITVLFLAALVIPTTLALTNQSDEKLNDLESVVVEGIGANRDKFKCGHLAWSNKHITTRFADSNRPAQELEGEYELWWDGSKKIATKYVRDEVHKDPEGNFRIEKGQGGTSYDGGVLSWKPDFHSDNWLGPEVTRWRGRGSQDWLIRQKSKLDHVTKDWSVIDANGANLIRCMSKNTNETARDYGAYSIRDYDPSKGYGLVNEEWYNPNGSPRLKHTVKMLEVIPGGWFPVEVDFKSFAITDGKVYSRNHHALDIERCSFNDKLALPKGIFKLGIEKQLKYQEKLQKYLAMELRGIPDVKEVAEADKVKRGAREAIEKFVAAAKTVDLEKAGEYAHSDKLAANHIADLAEIAKGQNLWIMAVVADDVDAIAVSSVIFGDHERIGPLVFFLDRKPQDGRDNWRVHDIDMETPDSAEVELKRFLEEHPKARKVPYEKKTDVELEVEKTASNNSGGDSKSHQHITFIEGMSIREALRFLGKGFKKNIIPSEKVGGQVPVNELYNVTFEEALQAILGTHKYIIDGKFIRVYTEEEFESIPEGKSNSQIEVEYRRNVHKRSITVFRQSIQEKYYPVRESRRPSSSKRTL
jgi:hypothetical protein